MYFDASIRPNDAPLSVYQRWARARYCSIACTLLISSSLNPNVSSAPIRTTTAISSEATTTSVFAPARGSATVVAGAFHVAGREEVIETAGIAAGEGKRRSRSHVL